MRVIIAPECEWHPNEKKIPPGVVEKLIGKVERNLGAWMSGDAKGYRRAKHSDYRAIYAIDPDDDEIAHILYIAHRDDKTYAKIEAVLSRADPT